MTRTYATALALVILAGCDADYPSEGVRATDINDRRCYYHALRRGVEFVVVFEPWNPKLNMKAAGGLVGDGRVGSFFRMEDGRAFSVEYRHGGPVNIDGVLYDLGDGRVFLVRLGHGGNPCEQLPVFLSPRGEGMPDEGYVRDELLRAAAGNSRLATFLGVGEK
jgi:hypothetical protein